METGSTDYSIFIQHISAIKKLEQTNYLQQNGWNSKICSAKEPYSYIHTYIHTYTQNIHCYLYKVKKQNKNLWWYKLKNDCLNEERILTRKECGGTSWRDENILDPVWVMISPLHWYIKWLNLMQLDN